jgi:hypothetical protein
LFVVPLRYQIDSGKVMIFGELAISFQYRCHPEEPEATKNLP